MLRRGGRSVFHFTHVFTKILRLWFGPLVNKWHLGNTDAGLAVSERACLPLSVLETSSVKRLRGGARDRGGWVEASPPLRSLGCDSCHVVLMEMTFSAGVFFLCFFTLPFS